MALAMAQECEIHGGASPDNIIFNRWAEVVPQGVEFGKSLGDSGELLRMRAAGISTAEVIDRLASLIK